MADKASKLRAAEAACVEDFNEDSETAVPETKKTANITAKRSKPEVTRLQVVRDEFSDSGHSNQTLATLGSTNTSLESKSGSLTIRAGSFAGAGTTRPAKIEEKPRSKSQSPEKLSSQLAALTARKEEIARKEPCSYSECVTKARRATFHHPSKATGKARPPVPEKPQHIRLPPAQAVKETPIPQYAPPRPRALASRSYHRERPVSLYAGAAGPESIYIQTQQPIYNETQPTLNYGPSAAAVIPPSYTSHATPYIPPPQPLHPPQPQQFYTSPPSPYEFQPRPRPRQWASEYQPAPRPQSMLYATSPIIEYVAEPTYAPLTTSTQPPSRQSSRRDRPRALPEQRSARDEDYYNMPPPPPPPPPAPPLPPRYKNTSYRDRRPAIRHAVTADAHPTYTHRRTVRDESTTAHVGHENRVKQNHGAQERARRPSRNTNDESASNIYGIERGMARTNIGSDAAKPIRRVSVYGHETFNELADEVEAYQASKGNGRTSNHFPIPPPSLTRKKTHTSSKSSETSSRKSAKSGKSRTSKTSKEGSDLKSRRPSENDKLSMRFDASQGVNVDLKGGMEGRRISVRQSNDEGEMEFSIGSRGRTTIGAGRESREKSRKRSSYRNGLSETEIERARTMSRPRMRIRGREDEEDRAEPRIIRERITTRTRSRRGSSRVGGERVAFI